MVDQCRIGQAARVVYLEAFALLRVDLIRDVGHGRDDIHVELAVEPLLYDLHVQQAEEAAPETESQGGRALGLEGQRRVVELQFLQRAPQVLEILGLDRIDPGEHHRFHLLEPVDAFLGRPGHVRDGIADTHLARSLDSRDDIPDVARADLVAGRHIQFQYAHLVGVVFLAGGDEFHVVAFADDAIDHLEIGDNAPERVEYGVEDQTLQRRVGIAFWGGYFLNDGVQQLRDALAGLAAGPEDILTRATQQLDDLVFHLVGAGARQVDLVDHRNDLQVVLDGHIEIRDGLRLDTLGGVDNQQGALAGRDRA